MNDGYRKCFELNGAPLTDDDRAWSSVNPKRGIVCLALFADVFRFDEANKKVFFDSFNFPHDTGWQSLDRNQRRIDHLLLARKNYKGRHRGFLTVAVDLDVRDRVALSKYVEGFELQLLEGEAGLNVETGEHRAEVLTPDYEKMRREIERLLR